MVYPMQLVIVHRGPLGMRPQTVRVSRQVSSIRPECRRFVAPWSLGSQCHGRMSAGIFSRC
jgi:hypothetical protein